MTTTERLSKITSYKSMLQSILADSIQKVLTQNKNRFTSSNIVRIRIREFEVYIHGVGPNTMNLDNIIRNYSKQSATKLIDLYIKENSESEFMRNFEMSILSGYGFHVGEVNSHPTRNYPLLTDFSVEIEGDYEYIFR